MKEKKKKKKSEKLGRLFGSQECRFERKKQKKKSYFCKSVCRYFRAFNSHQLHFFQLFTVIHNASCGMFTTHSFKKHLNTRRIPAQIWPYPNRPLATLSSPALSFRDLRFLHCHLSPVLNANLSCWEGSREVLNDREVLPRDRALL